jgi:hypothetical protein
MFALIFLSNLGRKQKKRKRKKKDRNRDGKEKLEQTYMQSSLLAIECKRKIREARSSFKRRECVQQVL